MLQDGFFYIEQRGDFERCKFYDRGLLIGLKKGQYVNEKTFAEQQIQSYVLISV